MNELHPGHFKIARKSHLSHLARIMPLIAMIYGMQIVLMSSFANRFVTQSLFFTGITLVVFLLGFYYYDRFQKTIITPEKLIMEFHPFYQQRAINIENIREVKVTDPGCSFSTLALTLDNGNNVCLYFIDHPEKIATIIENYRSARSNPVKFAA